MNAKKITKGLSDPRINVSGICSQIGEKGLSRSSLLNKLNKNHPHELSDRDMNLVKREFKKLSDFLLDLIN